MVEGFEIRWYDVHDKYGLGSWIVQNNNVYEKIRGAPLPEGAGYSYAYTLVTDNKLSTWYK